MPYGSMTPFLLAKFVGTPGGTVETTTKLADIPMWWGIFYDNPGNAPNPATVEILGDSYDRPAAAWRAFTTAGLVNNGSVPFLGLDPGTHIVAVGLWDAAVNGHLLAYDVFDAGDQVTLATGGSWLMPDGEFFLGFDLAGL